MPPLKLDRGSWRGAARPPTYPAVPLLTGQDSEVYPVRRSWGASDDGRSEVPMPIGLAERLPSGAAPLTPGFDSGIPRSFRLTGERHP
jgi:hypothetical protein